MRVQFLFKKYPPPKKKKYYKMCCSDVTVGEGKQIPNLKKIKFSIKKIAHFQMRKTWEIYVDVKMSLVRSDWTEVDENILDNVFLLYSWG